MCTPKCLCYKFFAVEKPWSDAESYCKTFKGGHLASVHSHQAAEFLDKLTTEDQTPWLGLYRKSTTGKYYWTDDSLVDFLPWSPFEPNSFRGSEDCILVYSKNFAADRMVIAINSELVPFQPLGWNDENCAKRNSFICQVISDKDWLGVVAASWLDQPTNRSLGFDPMALKLCLHVEKL